MAVASHSGWIATVRSPSSRQARMTRMAISPRLAMRIFLNIRPQKVRQGTTGRAGKSRGTRKGAIASADERNLWEFPDPVGLLRLDQHDGLRAAAAGDHVDPGHAWLDRRHRRLNGRLVHVFE